MSPPTGDSKSRFGNHFTRITGESRDKITILVVLWGYKKRRLINYSILQVEVRQQYSRIGLISSFHHRRQQQPRCGSLSGRPDRGHWGMEQVLCGDQSGEHDLSKGKSRQLRNVIRETEAWYGLFMSGEPLKGFWKGEAQSMRVLLLHYVEWRWGPEASWKRKKEICSDGWWWGGLHGEIKEHWRHVAVPASRQEATTPLIRRAQCGQMMWSSKDEIERKIAVFDSLEMAVGSEGILPKPFRHWEWVSGELKTTRERAAGETQETERQVNRRAQRGQEEGKGQAVSLELRLAYLCKAGISQSTKHMGGGRKDRVVGRQAWSWEGNSGRQWGESRASECQVGRGRSRCRAALGWLATAFASGQEVNELRKDGSIHQDIFSGCFFIS